MKTGHHTIAYNTLPEKTNQTFTIEKDQITPLIVPNCKLIVSPEEKMHKIEYLFSVTQKNAATPITGWMALVYRIYDGEKWIDMPSVDTLPLMTPATMTPEIMESGKNSPSI